MMSVLLESEEIRKERYKKGVRLYSFLNDRDRENIYDLARKRFPYYEEHKELSKISTADIIGASTRFTESYLFKLLMDIVDLEESITKHEHADEVKDFGKRAYYKEVIADPEYEKEHKQDPKWLK